MTESPEKFPWESDDPLMGPAVPESPAGDDDSLAEPLSPFVGGQASAGAEPVGATDDDMPWLLPDDAGALGFAELEVDSTAPELEVADPGLAMHEVATPEAASPGPAAEPVLLPDLEGPAPAGARSVTDEVADRLERIARSLRTTDPAELLSGASDPLEILIVGYVLGYSRAERSGGR